MLPTLNWPCTDLLKSPCQQHCSDSQSSGSGGRKITTIPSCRGGCFNKTLLNSDSRTATRQGIKPPKQHNCLGHLGEGGNKERVLLDTGSTDSGKREVWGMVLVASGHQFSLFIQSAKFYLYPNRLLFQPKEMFRVEQQTDLLLKGQEW